MLGQNTQLPYATYAMDLDRQSELNALRPDLLRFAHLQLRESGAAEDAVQETLLAALTGSHRFESRSSCKTWLISILRNKIIDIICGHWQDSARPDRWADPEASFEQQQFWKVFEASLDRLPAKTTRVCMMREFLGFETDEIWKESGISSSNCRVVLHRARLGLRTCLETSWFAGTET